MKVLERIRRFFKAEEESEEASPVCGCPCEEKTEADPTLCPVCGMYHFSEPGSYEICPVCGWEDDKVQREDPDFAGGANKLSLNEAKKAYEERENA